VKKVIIIDDEMLARDLLRTYLQEYRDLEIVAECQNGFDGAKAIGKTRPDLVFLDVQMPKITGLEMLEILDDAPPVIFTTAFDEFAIRAFDSNAVDYLLKPFTRERLAEALEKWRNRKEGNQDHVAEAGKEIFKQESLQRIVVKNDYEISVISSGDIFYIEAFDDYVKIFTDKTYYLKKQTLSYYEQSLDDKKFFRTHRSFIINLDRLTGLEPYEKGGHLAILRSGKKVPVSRSGYQKLKIRLGV
jgi:two-component system LytT family response regulator